MTSPWEWLSSRLSQMQRLGRQWGEQCKERSSVRKFSKLHSSSTTATTIIITIIIIALHCRHHHNLYHDNHRNWTSFKMFSSLKWNPPTWPNLRSYPQKNHNEINHLGIVPLRQTLRSEIQSSAGALPKFWWLLGLDKYLFPCTIS